MNYIDLFNITVQFGATNGYPVLNILWNGNTYNLFSSVNWDTVHYLRDLSGIGLLIYCVARIFLRLPNLLDGNFGFTPVDLGNDTWSQALGNEDDYEVWENGVRVK